MGFEYECGVCQCERFGTGVDGDYLQNGGTVTYTGPKHYNNCTLENNAVFGPADKHVGTLYGQGALDIDATSTLQSRWRTGGAGGLSRDTVGEGLNGTASYGGDPYKVTGLSGSGAGAGGGGTVNKGGNGGASWQWHSSNYEVARPSSGGTGQIVNGNNGNPAGAPLCYTEFTYNDQQFAQVGFPGAGSGSGGVDDIGTGATTGTSGAGAPGAQAGGYLNIRFREIKVAAAGGINCNGEDGADGEDATNSTDLNAKCGGGGGGPGGGGGLVRYMCETIDNPGNVQALGGASGVGGAGVGGGGTGGTGGVSGNGIVAPCCLAA